MVKRGVHFGVDEAVAEELRALGDDEAVARFARERLDEVFERGQAELVCETDRAWSALHRRLAAGGLGDDGGERDELAGAVLGGLRLHQGDDVAVYYKTPDQVRAIAEALGRTGVDALLARRGDGEDAAITRGMLEDLVRVYAHAASQGLGVVFSTAGAPAEYSRRFLVAAHGRSGEWLVDLHESYQEPPRWWMVVHGPLLFLSFQIEGRHVIGELLAFVDEAAAGLEVPSREMSLGRFAEAPVVLIRDLELDDRFFFKVFQTGGGACLDVTLTGRALDDLRGALRQLAAGLS
jgi:hypothetical protein